MEQPEPLCGFRWQDMTADDLVAILHADGSEPSYADQLPLIHDDHFSFSRHIHNTKQQPAMQQGQGLGSGFASPTTASLSPFGLSSESPSSVDDQHQPHHIQQLPHAFPFPPNTFPVYGQPSPSPSTSASASMPPPPPARPNKRARDEQDQPAAQRKMQHACTHCKKLKMKCTFLPGSERCERCIKKGHPECRVEGRKRNPGPNARELLLRDLKAKDALIAGLLKHIFDPHMGTPLSIAAGRLDPASLTRSILPPSPPDTDIEKRGQGMGMGVQGLMSLLTQASASIARGGAGAGGQAWKLEEESSESDEDEQESSSHTGTSSDEDDDQHHPKKSTHTSNHPARLHSLPSELAPHGLIARMSLDDGTPTPLERAISNLAKDEDPATSLLSSFSQPPTNSTSPSDPKQPPAMPHIPPSKIGLENPRYYHPGPGGNLPLREIIIERQMSIEILDFGIVNLEEVGRLFEIFYKTVNPALSILDEQLHTPTATRKRCPFLFTVVCAAAARYYTQRPELYPVLMHFAKKQAAQSLIDGWKSVELCQAYIIMGDYAPSARRWEEDRSYLYKGLAIRLAMDLNLHLPSRTSSHSSSSHSSNELATRETLNRTRTWLICFNIDRSASTQFGKCATLPNEDDVVRGSKEWYNRSRWNHPYDVHLCAYVQLLRLMNGFHEIVQDKGAMRMNKNIDYLAVTRIYDDQLTAFKEEWTARFEEASDPRDPAAVYRVHLMPVIVNYCKLVMYSFGFQHAFEKGLARGDPFFLRCWNAATSVVRGMAEVLGPTGFLKYTAECHFVFGTFASGFLFKLLRPEFAAMVDQEQRDKILELVTRLADVFERNAIDETHAPRLYARFLYGLVRKHSAPGSAVGMEGVGGGGAGGGGGGGEGSQGSAASSTPPATQRAPAPAPAPAPTSASTSTRGAAPRAAGSSSSRSTRSSGAQQQQHQQQSTAPSSSSSLLPTAQTYSANMPPPPTSATRAPTPMQTHHQPMYAQDPAQMPYGAQQQQQSGSWFTPQQPPQQQQPYGYGSFDASAYQDPSQPQHQPQQQPQFYDHQQGPSNWGQQAQYYAMDMDDQMLLPFRAITSDAFNQHMLLPGWNPQQQHQHQDTSSSASSNSTPASSGVLYNPAAPPPSAESFFGAAQGHGAWQ